MNVITKIITKFDLLILFAFLSTLHCHAQLSKGRILFDQNISGDNSTLFENLSREVHFDANRSAEIIKDKNGQLNSVVIIDKIKKTITNISYFWGKPVSYTIDDYYNLLNEEQKISSISEMAEEDRFGLDTTDYKFILGYKCYKVNLLSNVFYSTFEIPNLSDLEPSMKKALGGFPLEANISSFLSELHYIATSMDENFDENYFNIDLTNVEKIESKLNPKIDESIDNSDVFEIETNVMEFAEDNKEQRKIDILNPPKNTKGNYKFKNTGVSLNVPTDYEEDLFFENISLDKLWRMDLNEVEKKKFSFDFLNVDTVDIKNRYEKIIAFMNPHLNSQNSENSWEKSGKKSVLISFEEFQIQSFRGIYFITNYSDRKYVYILISTPKTYVIGSLDYDPALYKPNINNWISSFIYDINYQFKFGNDLLFEINILPEYKKLGSKNEYVYVDKDNVHITLKNIPLGEVKIANILNEEKSKYSIGFANIESDKTPLLGLESFKRKIRDKLDNKDVIYYQHIVKLSEGICGYMEAVIYKDHLKRFEEVKTMFESFKLK